ncbi:MAG: sensor histidine kinase [Rubrivivax sp.]
MDDREAPALMALKFELAMAIGQSVELAPMLRAFLVPLLNALKGAACQVWLRPSEDMPGVTRVAYPARSLETWAADAPMSAWIEACLTDTHAGPSSHRNAAGRFCHALPVGDEGVLVIEHAQQALPSALIDALLVVLMRLAGAVRACRDHERARRLLEAKILAERDRAEALDRMRTVLTLSNAGVLVLGRAGSVLLHNEAALRLLGSGEALAGVPGQPLRHLLARQQVQALDGATPDALMEMLTDAAGPDSPRSDAAGADAPATRGRWLMASQGDRVLDWTLRHAASEGESVLYLRDVTHEVEVDRMKSEFLSVAAHELRTPMVSVFGFTELLLAREYPEARRREILSTIHRQSSLLISMINDLLDLARIEARRGLDLQRRETPVAELVRDTVERLRGLDAERGLRVKVSAAEGRLWVDPGKASQALVNVLSNALKYSAPDTPVTIESIATDDRIGLRVIDRGIGMTAEQVERIFERFYRADPSGQIPGTGLGMCLVKEIVDHHGGEVEVHSRLGEGTQVTLWWPQAT